MTKLEELLRQSLIEEHCRKAHDFLARAKLAISPGVQLVLLEQAAKHSKEADQLFAEMQQVAS